MKKAFKYKLTLSDKQKRILSSWSGICRFLFNAGLEHRIVCWNQHRHTVSYKEQQNALPEIKKCPEFEWMKQVPSQALQCALRNLDRAFQRFFTKNGGFPRFKKKYQDDSLHFPTPNNFQLRFLTKKTGTVFLPKIGEIKFRCHRPWEGEVRNATVTRSGDDWFISFCCEVEIKAGHHSGGIVGIDLGVTNTLSTSHGELTTIPLDKIKKIEKRIGVLQRRQTKQKSFLLVGSSK